jgi:hypothetical protein
MERDVLIAALSAVEIGGGCGTFDGIADHPSIASVGLADQSRREVAVLCRDPIKPMLRINLQMRIGGDVTVQSCHSEILFSTVLRKISPCGRNETKHAATN